MRTNLAVVFTLIILAGINWSIMNKEKHLSQGDIIYLDLAPVDPRSLMQGDYMALRFEIGQAVYQALTKSAESNGWRQDIDGADGFVVIAIDQKRIASFRRIYTEDNQLVVDEMKIRYRVRNGDVKFATNAFFFEEGQGPVYEAAAYGEFRVDSKGELLLAAMVDDKLEKLGTDKIQ
ncbi:MAG: putative membrane-anchored protein [Gammaproteobacteria bacterium]